MSPTAHLEIDVEAFASELRGGGHIVDVRERSEYLGGHVPGSLLIPLDTLAARASELPTDRVTYLICASGVRSLTAARALSAAGYPAVSVAGGTAAWVASGRPVVTGERSA
jgi:rhodanese-related sulfurtransferase